MGYERRKSFNVHDPLGLIAMPMTPMTAGLENSVTDYPRNLITDGSQSTGVPTVLWTIGGALITALVLVGLVAPPGPTTEPGTSSRTGYRHTPRVAHIWTRLSSSRFVIQFASYLIEL